ncbi:MAG: Nif3-like dinuclear metal center hexameric protein [Candidatus Bipolaricaulota bacterium]
MWRKDVTAFMDSLFPPALAEKGDPTDLQVGSLDEPCRSVLVALELQVMAG